MRRGAGRNYRRREEMKAGGKTLPDDALKFLVITRLNRYFHKMKRP